MEPVRCLTCNAVLQWRTYENLAPTGSTTRTAFETMRIERFCCRRMYLSHSTALEEHLRGFPMRTVQTADYTLTFDTGADCVSEVTTN